MQLSEKDKMVNLLEFNDHQTSRWLRVTETMPLIKWHNTPHQISGADAQLSAMYYGSVLCRITSVLLYQQCSAPDSQVRRVSLIVYPLSSPFSLNMHSEYCYSQGYVQREIQGAGSKPNWLKLDDAQRAVNLVSLTWCDWKCFGKTARIWETSAHSAARL